MEDETRSWHTVVDLWHAAWQVETFSLVALLLLTVAQGVVPSVGAWVLSLLLDRVVLDAAAGVGRLSWPVLRLLGAEVLTMFIGVWLHTAVAYLDAELDRSLSLEVERGFYGKLNALPGLRHFENPATQDAISLAQNGAGIASSHAISALTQGVAGLTGLAGILVVSATVEPWLFALALAAAVPQLVAQGWLARRESVLMGETVTSERRAGYLGYLLSNPRPAKEIRVYGAGHYLADRLLDERRRVHQLRHRHGVLEVSWLSIAALVGVAVNSVGLVHVVGAGARGSISIGTVALGIASLGLVGAAASSLVAAIAAINESQLFLRYYQQVLDLDPDLPESDLGGPVGSTAVTCRIRDPSPDTAKADTFLGLELRGVSFRYHESYPWVLRDLDLKVPRGGTMAVVGVNGAGKSTLVKLLARLYDPVEGSILWNGEDIRDHDVATWRHHIGIVFQDFINYETSIRENVSAGDVSKLSNDAELWASLERVGLADEVRKMPGGLDAEASVMFGSGPTGIDLSIGQWQRVALARSLLRASDLMVLDEPTASLDAAAERRFNTEFAELVADRTAILVSHRLGTVRVADSVAVLEGGAIVAVAPHEELLASSPVYADLYGQDGR